MFYVLLLYGPLNTKYISDTKLEMPEYPNVIKAYNTVLKLLNQFSMFYVLSFYVLIFDVLCSKFLCSDVLIIYVLLF